MVADSLAQKIAGFNQNVAMLHKVVEMTKPVLENLKTVCAVQWFLGNVFMLLLFLMAGVLVYLQARYVKKMLPAFKLKVWRWHWIAYIAVFVIFLLVFNFLPGLGTNHAMPG